MPKKLIFKHKTIIIVITIIIYFAFPSETYSQINFYTDYQAIYDDNIYNNYMNTSDLLNNLSFGTAYNIENTLNNIQIYYEGLFVDYNENKTKSFNSHKFGLVETHLFGSANNPFNAGVNYSFRENRDEFSLYDFNQLSIYANYRHSISEFNFLLAGYIYNRNEYTNFNVFSNNEHKVFLRWISNFESMTSLIISTELNYKNYFEHYNFTEYANDASYIKLHLNIAQSFAENTGGNLFLIARKNLSEKSRYVINDSLIFYEEEIFNDLYSFDDFEAGAGFTHYFSNNFKINSELKYTKRLYTSLYAADLNGIESGDLRKDDLIGFGVGLEYNLSQIIKGISISGGWNYLKNISNDAYYEYSNQIFFFSIDYGF